MIGTNVLSSLDCNDDVGASDLLALLANWGQCPETPRGTNCCAAHEWPGCFEPDCVALVCGIDLMCCQVRWDEMCASMATELCKICE